MIEVRLNSTHHIVGELLNDAFWEFNTSMTSVVEDYLMFSAGHHTSGNIVEDPEHNSNDHRLGNSD